MESLRTTCCIVGGGPAGMMLGFLLARKGVEVTVLEKHKDFFRDFRGDTVHPSTLEVLHELGILNEFLTMPHQEIRHIGASIGGQNFAIADTTHLPTQREVRCADAPVGLPELSRTAGREISEFLAEGGAQRH